MTRTDLVPSDEREVIGARREGLRRLLEAVGRVQLHGTDRISLDDLAREYFRWHEPPPDGRPAFPRAG